MKNLKTLKIGIKSRVISFPKTDMFLTLRDMGFCEGKEFLKIRVSPLGTILICFDNTYLALRAKDAEKIEVE